MYSNVGTHVPAVVIVLTLTWMYWYILYYN